MLIYTNTLRLEPHDGAHSVMELLAEWLSWKTKHRMDPDTLLSDLSEKHYVNQGVLRTRLCPASTDAFGFQAEYSHVDFKIPARRWTTEVEIHQAAGDHFVECTVMVSVVDQMRVRAPRPEPSRPRLVVDIVEKCRPIGSTPGLFTRELTLETSQKFLNEVTRRDRVHPVIVFSCKPDGNPIIDCDRLQEQILGLAELYFIPAHVALDDLADAVGNSLIAWGGEAKILWPFSSETQREPSTQIYSANLDDSDRTMREMETNIYIRVMLQKTRDKAASR